MLINVRIAFYQLLIAEKSHLGARKIIDFSELLKFLFASELSIFTNSALHHRRRQSLNGSPSIDGLSVSLFLESNTDLSLTASPK